MGKDSDKRERVKNWVDILKEKGCRCGGEKEERRRNGKERKEGIRNK